MPVPFKQTVRQVADGEPVNAAVTNRGTQDNAQRTQHLKDVLDSLQSRDSIVSIGVTTEDLPVGTPVYFDGSSNVSRAALAAGEIGTQYGQPTDTSFVWGVIGAKTAPTVGDIVRVGVVVLGSLSAWDSLVDTGIAAPGHYYLSGQGAGLLTAVPPGQATYVGQLLADGRLLVRPSAPAYGDHLHYRFELWPEPAVADRTTDVQLSAGEWVITAPDLSARGWLPANTRPSTEWPDGWDATIAGNSFVYNLDHAQDAALSSAFPPVPTDGATTAQSGLILSDERVLTNAYGIWWASNDDGETPWNSNINTPAAEQPEIVYWFSRLLSATNGALVESLVNDPASLLNIQLLDESGEIASSGRLTMRVDELLTELTTDDAADLVVKSIVGKNVNRGPAVTTLKVLGASSITGSRGNAVDGWAGNVEVNLQNSAVSAGDVDVVSLRNARQDSLDGLPVVVLPVGIDCQPVYSFRLSPVLATSQAVTFRLWLNLATASPLPTDTVFDIGYLPPPTATATAPVPVWTTAVATLEGAATLAGITAAPGYVELPLPTFQPGAGVPANSLILLRITRQGATDGYASDIGILRATYSLTATS